MATDTSWQLKIPARLQLQRTVNDCSTGALRAAEDLILARRQAEAGTLSLLGLQLAQSGERGARLLYYRACIELARYEVEAARTEAEACSRRATELAKAGQVHDEAEDSEAAAWQQFQAAGDNLREQEQLLAEVVEEIEHENTTPSA